MKERQLTFHNGKGEEEQKMNSNIVFDIMDSDGDESDLWIAFSCGEDLENILNLYHQKNWKELFPYGGRTYRNGDVSDSRIHGITITASNIYGNFYFDASNRSFSNALVTLNLEGLADDNAKKINEIRKLLTD